MGFSNTRNTYHPKQIQHLAFHKRTIVPRNMSRYNCALLFLPLLSLVWTWTGLETASGFTQHRVSARRTTIHYMTADGDEEHQTSENGQFNWVEEWAMQGKEAVALMKVQERTQRVMLAQKTEDRIFDITKILDAMVDEVTGEISEANLPRAKELALETRNLQKEYKDLVTGEPSTLLETFKNLKLSEEDQDKKGEDTIE